MNFFVYFHMNFLLSLQQIDSHTSYIPLHLYEFLLLISIWILHCILYKFFPLFARGF